MKLVRGSYVHESGPVAIILKLFSISHVYIKLTYFYGLAQYIVCNNNCQAFTEKKRRKRLFPAPSLSPPCVDENTGACVCAISARICALFFKKDPRCSMKKHRGPALMVVNPLQRHHFCIKNAIDRFDLFDDAVRNFVVDSHDRQRFFSDARSAKRQSGDIDIRGRKHAAD